MIAADFLLGGLVSIGVGLDRTAAFQFMVSRPIVAAPLTGWLLGEPMTGLQVGAMVELLWLARLPVGAAVPPDDTQVAVGATALAACLGTFWGIPGLAFNILATLVSLPLGKAGQFFDRHARQANGRLFHEAELALEKGDLKAVERNHLWGLLHFGLASLGTYLMIIALGGIALFYLAPRVINPVADAASWLWLVFPLVGTAVTLGALNLSRSLTLFGASFSSALLMLWLL